MGTNYYIREKECNKCKRHEEIHLGKSSGGWEFSFQFNGGRYYKNIKEMRKWLKGKQIWNEYGEKISPKDFWKMVEDKKGGLRHAKETSDKSSFEIDGYNFTDCEFS